MRWFKRTTQPSALDPFDEDRPLLNFSPHDVWTIGDSYKHTIAFGASGSGKTSGSLATIFRTFLEAGYGGLILCAKPSERHNWIRYCKQTGREQSLLIVTADEGMPYKFNFLDYELHRKGRGAGSVTNIIGLFSQVMDIIENNTKESMSEDFWDRSALQMVGYAVIILSLCNRPLTLEDMERFIESAPQKGEPSDPEWRETSFCAQRIDEAYHLPKTPREQGDFDQAVRYFLKKLPKLGDRTRSSIEMTFTSLAGKFLIGVAHSLLVTETSIVPEVMWEDGAIVLLDFPTEDFGMDGRIIQGVLKFCFQKAMLRRNLKENPRPIFLAADEFQHFMSSYDYQFLSVAREAGVACVFATQNISNLYSILGSGGRDQANSLLGNCATKIFHANTDVPTNDYGSSIIGQEWMEMVSTSVQQGAQAQDRGSVSMNQQIHSRLLPSDFIALKTGGKAHDYQVEAYVTQTGRGQWQSTGTVYHKASFIQDFGE